MGLLDEVVAPPRRKMTLFLLVDTSGSMAGDKIAQVNDAIENVLPMVQEISDNNADSDIEIAILKFSNSAEWLYEEPKSVSEFIWPGISASGMTAFGDACKALLSKLNKESGFMSSKSGYLQPAIILLSDGGPTQPYRDQLENLKNNRYFQHAIKIAIAIGNDADKNVLCEFTGSSEAIITVHTLESLKEMIKLVIVSSTKVGSKSSSVGSVTKQQEVIKEISDTAQSVDGVELSTSTIDSSAYEKDGWD